jgi:hypothetical protein
MKHSKSIWIGKFKGLTIRNIVWLYMETHGPVIVMHINFLETKEAVSI